MRKTLLFVDGNFYMNRAWHVIHTENSIGRALGALMTSMICRDAITVKATHVIVGFDGMSFRYDIYDDYKHSRKKKTKGKSKSDETTKEIYTYMKDVQMYIGDAGIPFVHPPKHEADDVGAVCAAMGSKDLRVVIATKDKDSIQLLNPNVVMYNSNIKYPKNPYTLADIAISKYGVESHQMVDYQTLVGDKGDDVPTLLGPAKVKKILAKYGSIRNWYKKGPRGGKRWLTEHSEEILRNRKLVQLIDDCIEIDINDLKVPRLTKKVQSFPSAWHDYQSFLYPKSRGLF